MCGRFTQHHDADAIIERFGVQHALFEPEARYNIAPTQPVPVVVTEASTRERILDAFQWGLVPHWAKDPSIGNRMINARAETVAEKPAFKSALMRRRCILPSDGFYEWDKTGGTRQPYHFHRRDGNLFGFAGLWDEWQAPDGSPLFTCTILTTSANETVARIHDRMPVILRSPVDEEEWLNPDVHRPDDLLPLLSPYPDAEMEAMPVSRRVNIPANDDADLLSALTAPETNSL
jgi:putative SOS response-associated peptidase YedK